MINIIYKRLFNLKVAHGYYVDSMAKGLRITPTKATAEHIRNNKMLFKFIPNGVVVLYKTLADESSPLVSGSKDQRFTFSLQVDNADEFLNVTDLDESPVKKFQSSNIVYFKNDPAGASTDANNAEAVGHTLIDSVRPSLFTYEFTLSPSPAQVVIKVTNDDGSLVSFGKNVDGTPFPTAVTISKDADNLYSQQIDLYGKPFGRYTITIRNAGDTTTLKEEIIYISNELASQKVMGIVDIVYNTGTDHIYGSTEHYLLDLQRKETVWKYFIVDKNKKIDLSAIDLSIADEGPGGGDPYVVNTFNRDGAEPHASIRINDLDTVIFKSDVPIPFYERPKLNLELKTNPGDDRLVTHLPNPSHSGVVKDEGGQLLSEIYVFI